METQELIEYLNDFNRGQVKEEQKNMEVIDLGVEWLDA